MNIDRIIEVGSLIVGSGAISSIITNWFNKRKSGAETDSIIVGNIMDWAVKLSARIDKLEAQLVEKDRQIDELNDKIHEQDLLIHELQSQK